MPLPAASSRARSSGVQMRRERRWRPSRTASTTDRRSSSASRQAAASAPTNSAAARLRTTAIATTSSEIASGPIAARRAGPGRSACATSGPVDRSNCARAITKTELATAATGIAANSRPPSQKMAVVATRYATIAGVGRARGWRIAFVADAMIASGRPQASADAMVAPPSFARRRLPSIAASCGRVSAAPAIIVKTAFRMPSVNADCSTSDQPAVPNARHAEIGGRKSATGPPRPNASSGPSAQSGHAAAMP